MDDFPTQEYIKNEKINAQAAKRLTEPWTITDIQMSVGEIITCAILDGSGNYASQPHCIHISSLDLIAFNWYNRSTLIIGLHTKTMEHRYLIL